MCLFFNFCYPSPTEKIPLIKSESYVSSHTFDNSVCCMHRHMSPCHPLACSIYFATPRVKSKAFRWPLFQFFLPTHPT